MSNLHLITSSKRLRQTHDDVIKWKHFPRYWPFVRGIHRSPVNSPHKGQWRGALMFSLICIRINDWVNNGEAGDLRRHLVHYDVTVMQTVWRPFCCDGVIRAWVPVSLTYCPFGKLDRNYSTQYSNTFSWLLPKAFSHKSPGDWDMFFENFYTISQPGFS